MPKITVGIPVYNAEKTIARAIQSVLNQTYTDFELIITDDGSTDGTLQVIQSFDDPRIRLLIDKENKGISFRLNQQISLAQGDYFARMDADDIMFPNRLQRQFEVLEQNPEIDVLGSSVIVVDENCRILGYRGKIEKNGMTTVDSFSHPTVMGKLAWFKSHLYNENYSGWEDYELWLRTSKQSEFRCLNEPLLFYKDSQRYNIRQYAKRRKVGRMVLYQERKKFSFFLTPYWLIFVNCLMLAIVYVAHVLHLDFLILKRRNKKIKGGLLLKYKLVLAEITGIRLKVLHVITSLLTGGAEKLMVDLLPRLRDRGNNVELVLFNGTQTPFYHQLKDRGIKIRPLQNAGNVYNPLNIFRMRKFIKEFDVIHTHNTASQLFSVVAKSLTSAHPFMVTTEHNTSNRRRNKPWLKPLDKWMYRRYNRIICISDKAEENLKEYLGPKFTQISTIYNGIDLSRFHVQPSENALHPQPGQFSTVMVAAFREQKDQLTLIKAHQLLPDNYHLYLVGTGDEALIEKCKTMAVDLNITDRVHLLGMRTDVPELLASADAVVMSSHYEGLSLSSLEGMACGKPFIASDVDGLHEIVDGYGILFPHEDAQSLANSIKKVSTDKEYAASIAAKCQQRAAQFDINLMAENYNRVYSEMNMNANLY